jgi:hypothetical protein
MIIYNTLMGVSAGLALILVVLLVRKLSMRKAVAPEGWAVSFGVLGVLLAVLGGLMSTTWPLTVNPPINIFFGEPCMFFGVLLIAAAIFLATKRDVVAKVGSSDNKVSDDAYAYLMKVMYPVSWVIFGLGLVLASCTLAVLRFSSNFIGAAPAAEPISGLFNSMPIVENLFFVVLYGLAAVGALLFPWMARNKFTGGVTKLALACLFVSGLIFLLFSAMNYYTHIGLLVNTLKDTNFRF